MEQRRASINADHRRDELLLFVHGLGGDAEKTWRGAGRPGFKELIDSDKAVRDRFDVEFFDYPTSLWRLPFMKRSLQIQDLAQALRTQIETLYGRYERIVLVCHSLGGLIARQYVLEEIENGRSLRVDQLLLYAVPNWGSGMASIGRHISWRHGHLRQLAKNSGFVVALNDAWVENCLDDRISVRFMLAGQDAAVDKDSAVTEVGRDNVELDASANHRSIVKPSSHTDLAYAVLRKAVLGPYQVFLSVGSGRSEDQDRFVAALRALLANQNIEAAGVDEYTATTNAPLRDIENRMDQCFGAVIVAFERLRVEHGSSRPDTTADSIDGNRYPSVWNQIESAMAYTRGLPILVLVEDGLVSEGLLESTYDWRVKWVRIGMDLASDPEFKSMFRDWRAEVALNRDRPVGIR